MKMHLLNAKIHVCTQSTISMALVDVDLVHMDVNIYFLGFCIVRTSVVNSKRIRLVYNHEERNQLISQFCHLRHHVQNPFAWPLLIENTYCLNLNE